MTKTKETSDINITLDNQDTQPDVIHGVAQAKLNTPAHEWKAEDDEHIEKIITHPNTSSDTISKLYNHAFPKMDTDGEALTSPHSSETVDAIFQNNKASLADAEDYINRSYKNPNYANRQIIDKAAKHPGLSDEFKETKTNEFLDSPEMSYVPQFNHKAKYLHSLLLDRPLPEPEEGRMTQAQKNTNTKVKKLDSTIFNGLSYAQHTPEEYDHTTKILTSDAPYGYQDETRNDNDFSVNATTFIRKQTNLPTKNLEAFVSAYGNNSALMEEVVKHPNADTALISKIALSSKEYEGYYNPRSAAIASPKLPEPVRQSMIDSFNPSQPDMADGNTTLYHLLQNDHLPAQDVYKIFQKTKNIHATAIAALAHPNADPSMIEDYYQNSDPKKGAAWSRDILKLPNTPANVLRDIVSSNKNADVSIEAMSHKNADMSVVEAGLKRKMKAVQDAATKNPLVAHKVLRDRLKNGSIRASHILFDKETNKAFGEITKEDINTINERYKKKDQNISSDDTDFGSVKYWLSTNEAVPEAIKKQNRQDLIGDFLKAPHEKQDSSDISSHIIRLAQETGDQGAKDALLQKPDEVIAKLDYTNANFDTAFLDRAEPLIEAHYNEKHKNDQTKKPYEAYLKPLLQNPNLSQKTFDKISLSENYLKHNDLMNPSYSRWNSSEKEKKQKTILDTRYSDLDDAGRAEGFQKIANLGTHEAASAILESATAPSDIWNKAFSEYDAEKRARFLSMNADDVTSKMDEVNLTKTLFGEHNLKGDKARVYAANGLNSQIYALNGLDSSNPIHVKTLNNYINKVYGTPDRSEGFLPYTNVIDAIDSHFWKNPESDSVVKTALAKDNMLGVAMALKKEWENKPYSGDGKQFVEGLKKQFSFDNNPKAYYDRWQSLYATGGVVKGALDQLRAVAASNNGSLDFLANIPGDAENGFELRSKALQHGLLSKEGTHTILRSDPKMFGDALDGMPSKLRTKNIQAALDVDTMHPDVMNGIMSNLNYQSIINPDRVEAYSREKMSDEDWNVTTGYAEALVDHALNLNKAGKLHSNVIANIASRLVKNAHSDARDGLTTPQKKELVTKITDRILNSPIIDVARKSDILSVMADSDIHGDLIPTNLKDALASVAIESGDIDTLIQLKDEGNGTKAVTAAISKVLKNTASLSNEQLYSVSKLLKRDDLSDKNAMQILDGISKKLSSGNEADLNAVTDTMGHVALVTDWANTEVSTKAVDHLLAAASSKYANVSKNATDHLLRRMHLLTPEAQRKVFTNLPSELDENYNYVESDALSSKLINDPEVLLTATHGWKLKAMVFTAISKSGSISANSAEVLTNRVIDNNEITSSRKLQLAVSFSESKIPEHQQAAINLFRAQGGRGALEFLKKIDKGWGSSTANTATGVAATHAINYIEENYNTNKSNVNEVNMLNIGDTISDLKQIADIAYDARSDTTGSGHQQIIDAMVKSIDVLHSVHGSAIAKIENHAPAIIPSDVEVIHNKVGNYLQRAMSVVKVLPAEAALNLLKATAFQGDLVSTYFKVNGNITYEESKSLVNASESNNGKMYETLSDWMGGVNLPPEKFAEAFTIQPNLKLMLNKLNNISLDVVKSVDITKMLDDNNADAAYTFASSLEGIPSRINKDEAPQILDHMIPNALMAMDKLNKDFQGRISEFVSKSVEAFPDHFNENKLNDIASQLNNDKFAASMYTAAAKSGAGGNGAIRKAIDLSNDSALPIARSAKLDKDMVSYLFSDAVMKGRSKRTYDRGRMAIALSGNKNIDADSVSMLYDFTKSHAHGEDTDKILGNLIEHPNLNFDIYKSLYHYFNHNVGNIFLPGVKFNKAFLNRKYGGELLRSLPASLPAGSVGVEDVESKLPKSFEYSLQKERLKGVMANIPAEGIHWADFKKQNQQAANWNEVKSVFLSKKDDIARPEDFVNAMNEYGGDFHITFSRWEGAQRHATKGHNKPNLVVQLNTGEKMEAELKEDPKLFSFFQMIQKAANNTGRHEGHAIGGHPVTPFCASWVRVDTSAGKEGWIIEEFQSDFSASLSQQVDMIKEQHPDGLTLDGQHFHPDEMKSYARRIEKIISGWHEASSRGMEDFARKQGVKTLYLHGEQVRAQLSNMEKGKANPIWMQQMYNNHPKANGWEATVYNDYPNFSTRFMQDLKNDGRDLKCWKKEIK